MTAQRGQLFKAPAGTWAIRYRDANGKRRQRNGYRSKGEAAKVLDDALRRVRLGPLYRPAATLQQLVDEYIAQYDAAPSSVEWLRYNLGKALPRFGDQPIGTLRPEEIAKWRASLPAGRRHPAHRALRQVLAAALRWKWIDENPATLVKNPASQPEEINPFDSWEQVAAVAAELGEFGALVVFLAGTGARPEEAFGAEWRDVDLDRRTLAVRRAFAKHRLKEYTKTVGSRRSIPLRGRVVEALDALPHRRGILFPAAKGGRLDINNWRAREWVPALKAAGVEHRRIYDLRHTYATWSLAAGVNIFTLARRMGTSVQMIDRTYGHLAADADDYERQLLDAFDRNGGLADGEATKEEARAALH